MAQSGPSREELENYYKNSRQYFDELAKHYYETDREYYDKFIAPFYSPFASITTSSSSTKARPAILIIAILIAMLSAGIAFLLVNFEKESDEKEIKKIEETRDPVKKETPPVEKKSPSEKKNKENPDRRGNKPQPKERTR